MIISFIKNKNNKNNKSNFENKVENEDFISPIQRAMERRTKEILKKHRIDQNNPIFKELQNRPPTILKQIIDNINFNPKKLFEDYEYLQKYSQTVLEDFNNLENYQQKIENRNPIVFIPGLGGTQLVSENTKWKNFPKCSLYQRFDGTIWVGLNPNTGGTCNASIVKSIYDKNKGIVKTNEYTTVKVKGKLGSFDCCNCLNDTSFCLAGTTEYAKKFKKSLENVGYIEMVDMFAVGYDFRLVPHIGDQNKLNNIDDYGKEGNHFGRFFLNSKYKKVFLVGHSMGGLLISAFLNICRRVLGWNDWVDKYIAGFIPVGYALDGILTVT